MIRRDIAITLALLAAFAGCTCTDIAGPDAQLREAARGFEQLRSLPALGLSISRLQITRITPEPDLKPPRVVFSFDLDGSIDGVKVSAIGVERTPMALEDGRWTAVNGDPLPNLAAVLSTLHARSHPSRLLIRTDVGKTLVTEEFAPGQGPGGDARRQLELDARADGGFDIHE